MPEPTDASILCEPCLQLCRNTCKRGLDRTKQWAWSKHPVFDEDGVLIRKAKLGKRCKFWRPRKVRKASRLATDTTDDNVRRRLYALLIAVVKDVSVDGALRAMGLANRAGIQPLNGRIP